MAEKLYTSSLSQKPHEVYQMEHTLQELNKLFIKQTNVLKSMNSVERKNRERLHHLAYSLQQKFRDIELHKSTASVDAKKYSSH